MYTKKIFLLITLLCTMLFTVQSQVITQPITQPITLEECQRKAVMHYPAIARFSVIERTRNFSLSNANRAYWPHFSLEAQATWQSDVTKVPIEIAALEIPELDREQYRVTASVNQIIWDGGQRTAQKGTIDATAEMERRQLETEIYSLRERVNNLFFGVLLINEQLAIQSMLEEELQRNNEKVQSYIDNGIANEADLSAVIVEQLRVGQGRIEKEAVREAYMKMLSLLIGETIDIQTTFVKPSVESNGSSPVINRPELTFFDAQESFLETQKGLLSARNRPVIGAFAQGGYGKPALDMFENRLRPYFLGGVRFSWNFGNLYTYDNEKKKIELQKKTLDSQRETFLFNLNLQIPQQQTEIEKFSRTMRDDDEIIRLRTLIRKAAEAKVENGTMTVSDMLEEVTSEEAAREAKVLHEIQYLLSVYNLKYTTN